MLGFGGFLSVLFHNMFLPNWPSSSVQSGFKEYVLLFLFDIQLVHVILRHAPVFNHMFCTCLLNMLLSFCFALSIRSAFDPKT
jgi:hypothetical protein